MNGFEEARNHGYSAADQAADMAEQVQRCNELGCYQCKYSTLYHATCEGVINGTLTECPYRKGFNDD